MSDWSSDVCLPISLVELARVLALITAGHLPAERQVAGTRAEAGPGDMVGRAVENILRLHIGRQDRGFVDLDLGIAEAITGAEIESADPPRERRSGVDRIEVGDIAGVADEQAAVRALPVEIGR